MNLKRALLEGAKQRLEDGDDFCICFALDNAAGSVAERISVQDGQGLRDIWKCIDDLGREIADGLGRFTFLEGWVKLAYDYKLSPEQALLCRLAWIDKMLADLPPN